MQCPPAPKKVITKAPRAHTVLPRRLSFKDTALADAALKDVLNHVRQVKAPTPTTLETTATSSQKNVIHMFHPDADQ